MVVKQDRMGSARSATSGAERAFFPAAALYGLLAVPVSIGSMLGGPMRVPGLSTPAAHAHELLFGYALAVVAGYLGGPRSTARVALLLGLWLAARLSYLMAPQSVPASISNVAFAGALALTVAPKLIRGAKKWRNKLLGPLILAIATAVAVFHLALAGQVHRVQYIVLRETVLLLALLMLFMGGRIIAPAVAGAVERAGGRLEARVQPRIEAALLVIMLLAVLGAAVPHSAVVTGGCLIGAGALAAVRLLRWRLWRCGGRADLLCLGVGYGWLAAGLALLGSAWLGLLPVATATHGITVGALGTLTTAVMGRVHVIKCGGHPEVAGPMMAWVTIAMSAAALVRICGGGAPGTLWVAAASWSAALALLLVLFRRFRM